MNKRMGLLGGLILIVLCSSAKADNTEDAKKAFTEASVKQLGIDEALNEWVKNQIPKKYMKLAEQAAPFVEMATTGTLKFTWSVK